MVQKEISIFTQGQGLYDVTREISSVVSSAGRTISLVNIFIKHTSASLIIQENASLDVTRDIKKFFNQLVPEGWDYEHSLEGPDDMPSHIKSILTNTSLTIPVRDGKLNLGTWQSIFVFEHRKKSLRRNIIITII